MSAQVTEAHRELAYAILFATEDGHAGPNETAQLIADSEAKACDQLRAEVAWWKNWHEENEKLEDGIAVKVQATIDQLRAEVERLKAASDKEDSMATTTIDQRDRAEDAADKLASAILGEPIDWPDHDAKWSEALEEAECVHDLKASLSEMIAQSRVDSSVAGIAICNEMGAIARAERAEAELKEWSLLNLWGGTPEIIHDFVKGQQARIHAAQDVEAELAGIRALADRRNERDHSQDTTHQLVAALDQALDIAQAELVQFRELDAERARLADLVADLNDACITLESAENDCDDYAMQNTAFKLNAVRAVLLQYIPNAAMKEGGK